MSVCHLNLMQAKTSSLLPAPDNSQNHNSLLNPELMQTKSLNLT